MLEEVRLNLAPSPVNVYVVRPFGMTHYEPSLVKGADNLLDMPWRSGRQCPYHDRVLYVSRAFVISDAALIQVSAHRSGVGRGSCPIRGHGTTVPQTYRAASSSSAAAISLASNGPSFVPTRMRTP